MTIITIAFPEGKTKTSNKLTFTTSGTIQHPSDHG
jgi:hypothetical protein